MLVGVTWTVSECLGPPLFPNNIKGLQPNLANTKPVQ